MDVANFHDKDLHILCEFVHYLLVGAAKTVLVKKINKYNCRNFNSKVSPSVFAGCS